MLVSEQSSAHCGHKMIVSNGNEKILFLLTLIRPGFLGNIKTGGGRNQEALVPTLPFYLQINQTWSQMKADIFIYL